MNKGNQTSPFHWDAFDAYLFDVDGTLLHCADAVHYSAFCDSLSAIAGKPMNLDGVATHGNTDMGILRDAFSLAGVPRSAWHPRLPEIRSRMAAFVQERKQEFCVHTLPMVRNILVHLRSRGAVTGVATGNFESIGTHKLFAAGISDLFDFFAWSDGLEQRADVFARAVVLARSMAGRDARMVVIGDTPADVRAAHATGLPVIAVATGIYTHEQLQAEHPEICLHSLEELSIPA